MGASVLDPGSSPNFAGDVEPPPWPCPRVGTKRTARRAVLVQLRLTHLVVIRSLALHDGEVVRAPVGLAPVDLVDLQRHADAVAHGAGELVGVVDELPGRCRR
eukprot:3076708-Pyramimonas_sp.AAC.1